jgi:hypothetical protein
MGDIFLAQCPTVATIGSSEVRFSIKSHKVKRIPVLPKILRISHVACKEIAPTQSRMQWGLNTGVSPRLDSYQGLRFGSEKNNLTLGYRSTNVGSGSRIAQVENQRVGVASLTLDGRFRFKYWNDHSMWWWPMADGGDKGDTAGLQFSYNLGHHGFRAGKDWQFNELSLTMRLGTGIPDPKSIVPMGDGQLYSRVEFSAIDRGDLAISTSLTGPRRQRLELGLVVNSGAVRHTIQSDIVHRNMGIPELPRTNHVEVMIYIKLFEY